jgi:rhodanese-related sulfurtransferase
MYREAAGLVANRRYKNVATFKGGLPAWKKAGFALNTSLALPKHEVPTIDGDQFQELVGTACFVDIRTPRLYGGGIDTKSRFGPKVDFLTLEYRKKYLLKIPMSKMVKQYHKIPDDRKIVVFDFRGKQCLMAARFLIEKGFKDVCILKGGISAAPSKTD